MSKDKFDELAEKLFQEISKSQNELFEPDQIAIDLIAEALRKAALSRPQPALKQ